MQCDQLKAEPTYSSCTAELQMIPPTVQCIDVCQCSSAQHRADINCLLANNEDHLPVLTSALSTALCKWKY